ncbi:hypothetical protein [Actinoplanes regularis]|uniref:hypothetical protein n=1 Tax=Actinoplanes regularis TaxID=52697 RepID=UPI0024A100F3|nr:hypothetical protein [Actinoplanes regularis]GLW30754.1 hypothetical protein Areg01_36940 [Actinoplanes regularis]
MPRLAPFVALALIVGMTGCADEKSPGPSPSGPSTIVSPAPVDDPPGLLTCRHLAMAVRDASLMEPGVVQDIVATSATADAPVADAATALGRAYANALVSRDTRGEPDAIAAVSAAAADMSQVCADSGLDSAN